MRRLHLILLITLLLPTCDSDGRATEPTPDGPDAEITIQRVANGLSFPVHIAAPRGDSRVFVVEKTGRVRILSGGNLLTNPFLDLSGEVSDGSEQGLLSIAFHPNYAANGRFYVNYTDLAGDTQIVEYRVSADPDRADAASARRILTVPQPFSNHNGGQSAFGPDGKLYIGMGDGGGGGDPQENAQDLSSLLGKMLRIDVDSGSPYGVPSDNPLVGDAGARGEIWALGLRNPWRFSFDRETGDLYIGDVGQNQFEEIDAVRGTGRGLNYGWDLMEGRECFEPSSGCERDGLTLPVVVYGHSDGCSVTGGHVYRGQAIAELRGTYFYSDFCSGFVRGFRFDGSNVTGERRWAELETSGDSNVTSFGEDGSGELYYTTRSGNVYKIVTQ